MTFFPKCSNKPDFYPILSIAPKSHLLKQTQIHCTKKKKSFKYRKFTTVMINSFDQTERCVVQFGLLLYIALISWLDANN